MPGRAHHRRWANVVERLELVRERQREELLSLFTGDTRGRLHRRARNHGLVMARAYRESRLPPIFGGCEAVIATVAATTTTSPLGR
jgi:hypothetical protein